MELNKETVLVDNSEEILNPEILSDDTKTNHSNHIIILLVVALVVTIGIMIFKNLNDE